MARIIFIVIVVIHFNSENFQMKVLSTMAVIVEAIAVAANLVFIDVQTFLLKRYNYRN